MSKKLISCCLFLAFASCLVGFTMFNPAEGEDYLRLRVMDEKRLALDDGKDRITAMAEIQNVSDQQVEFGILERTRRLVKCRYGWSYHQGKSGFSMRPLPSELLSLAPQERVFIPIEGRVWQEGSLSADKSYSYRFNYLSIDEKILDDAGNYKICATADGGGISSMDSVLEDESVFGLKMSFSQENGCDFLRVQGFSGNSAQCVSAVSVSREGDALELIVTTRLVGLLPDGARGDFQCILVLPSGVNRLLFGEKKQPIWQR